MESLLAPSLASRTNLETLRERVFERKPFLQAIIEKLGGKSLLEYVRGYEDMEIHAAMLARQEEFLETFEREVAETFGADIAKRARAQMQRTYFASTNDHHGPINAFDMFNAHLIQALAAIDDPKNETDAIILFSCCNVSLNNITFPRGLLFTVNTPQGLAQRRLSLLPSNSHASALYGYRAYEPREIEKLQKLLRQNVREGTLSKDIAAKLERIVAEILGDPAIIARKTYSAQASIINSKLWGLVFEKQPKAPILVSVGQERLTSRLLQDHHLGRGTLLDKLLFSADCEKLIQKHFDGIYGAFSTKDNTGTYLFWGRSATSGLRLKMKREGSHLVSENGELSIAWNPEAIAAALKARTLIPSLLLVFGTLSFYYGLKCLGGYSQVNYLTFMKEAFMAMMHEMGMPEAADACVPVSTKNWSGFTFTYLENGEKTVMPAQFLDLHLYGDDGMWQRLLDYAHICSLRSAVQPLLPEIYRYSYAEHEREAHLLALTTEQIAAETGLIPSLRAS